jgi:hypothetical protein
MLVLVLTLAACQPVPQPFAPGIAERGNPLVLLPDRAGVVVLEINGAPADAAGRFPDAMIKALLARNIPAWATSGNRASYFLQGDAKTESMGDGWVRVTMEWDLVDPRGAQIGRHSLSRKARWTDWRDGSKDLIAGLATESATGIAVFMQEALPETPAARSNRIPLYVTPIAGAPGDGPKSLRLAMMAALRRAKLRIVEHKPADKPGEIMEIAGRVQVGPARNKLQAIDIVWAVRGPDGEEIGSLKQSNAVPAGSLDKGWGQLAFIVADAAVGGVIDLLKIPGKK